MVSDASGFKAAIYSLHNSESVEAEFTFSEQEKRMSSGARELLAVQKMVAHWVVTRQMHQRNIYWITDSANVVSFLEKGSSRPHIQRIIFDVATKLSLLKSVIQPVHVFREDERITKADEASKAPDSDDWSLDKSTFEDLARRFRLITDVFASNTNARLGRFYSKFYCEGCLGVDAFAHRWGQGLWMCPPVSLLARTADEIRRRSCSGILVFPDWPTSYYYGKFFDGLGTRHPFKLVEKIRPYVYQNQGARGPLNGHTACHWIVLQFDTTTKI